MVSSTTEEGDPVRSYEETKPMAIRLPYLDAIRKVCAIVHVSFIMKTFPKKSYKLTDEAC